MTRSPDCSDATATPPGPSRSPTGTATTPWWSSWTWTTSRRSTTAPAGHAAGDRVLAATAQRLTAWAGNRGAVGRLGGDEFAATVRITPARRELRLAQLVTLLAQPVQVDGGALVDVAASVGAASPDVIGTTDLTLLQRAADAAMYAGKHTGRAVIADRSHATAPSINGRRAGRPGTHTLGAAA